MSVSAVTRLRPAGLIDPADAAERIFAAASELNRIGLSANSYSALIAGIRGALRPLIASEKVGLALLVENDEYLQQLPGSFDASDDLVASSQVHGLDPRSASGQAMTSGRTWVSNDAITHIPDFGDWVRGFGISQLLTAPLSLLGSRFGVLQLANIPGGFEEADVLLLDRLLPFVSTVVASVEQRIRLERREAIADVTSEVASRIIASGSLQRISDGALNRFCDAARVSVLAISFVHELKPRVLIDHAPVAPELRELLLRETGGSRQAVRTRRMRPQHAGDAGASFAYIPVMVGGTHRANLSLLRVPGSPFTVDEMKASRRLANVTALAWATESAQRERELRARADERQRIGDDLHDHVSQLLFSAELHLQAHLESQDSAEFSAPGSVSRARELLVRAEITLRDSVRRLSGPGVSNIRDALEAGIRDIEEEFGVAIGLRLSESDVTRLADMPSALAGVVVRAAREGMVNAAKHAQATTITAYARILNGTRLEVSIVDDGRAGPDTRSVGHGLAAMQRMLLEFGGTVNLTRPNGSTVYRVSVPIAENPNPPAE